MPIDHNSGTDFTPTTGIEGFVFLDDGVEIPITAAVRTNAALIILTLDSEPTGVEELYYGYGTMSTVDPTNLVEDNATVSLALLSNKITL